MLGRIAGRVLVAVAFATVPASASADVGAGDWGISDDFHVPAISLDESFDELAPSSFRMIAAWDRLGDPAYRAQIQSRIDEANATARTPGGMEIAVSFSVPPQYWQGVPLTGQAWIDQVMPFIDKFTPDVEWWSPVNEPGLKGWTFTPAGASTVADFSVRLKNNLEQSHPTDRLLSPDFNDHYNADGTLKRHTDGTSFVERVRCRQVQELPEHRRPGHHARRHEGSGAADLGDRGRCARERHARPRPDRSRAGRPGEMDDRHGGRVGVARRDNPNEPLPHAPRGGHNGVVLSAEGRLPLGHGPGPGVR